jgi:hypothetical protein
MPEPESESAGSCIYILLKDKGRVVDSEQSSAHKQDSDVLLAIYEAQVSMIYSLSI